MIHTGDLFDVVPRLYSDAFDACITDPPYGIGFMGKQWDTFKPGRVVQPKRYAEPIQSENPNLHGRRRSPAVSPSQIAYDLSTKGLRAYQAWCEQWGREVFRILKPGAFCVVHGAPRSYHRMACGLEDAGFEIRDGLQWLFGQGFPKSLNLGDGKGTALKPAYEPIVLAWKPFKGTLKNCHKTHGTAALSIAATRVDGRWPTNVILDEAAAARLDAQAGHLVSGFMHAGTARQGTGYGGGLGNTVGHDTYGDAGGPSRFYYVAKPSRAERDSGCYDLPARSGGEATNRKDGSAGVNNPRAGAGRTGGARNIHPTVKPVELMRWLVRLVTRPGGLVVDPFCGSGTTGMACALEQRQFVGIEREAAYVRIAERRIFEAAPLLATEVPA